MCERNRDDAGVRGLEDMSEVHGQVQLETLLLWPPPRGSSEEQVSAEIDR